MRSSLRSVAALVVPAMLALGATCCTSLTDAGEYRVRATGPDADTCPLGTCECGGFMHRFDDERACAACVAASCCPEGDACRAHPACAESIDCRAACLGDSACLAACGAFVSSPESEAFARCLRDSCLEACFPCGSLVPPGGAPEEPRTCFECSAQVCCTEHAACLADAECADAVVFGVEQLSESTWELYSAVTSCSQEPCQVACGLGADWSCVGRAPYPSGDGEMVDIAFVITNFVTGEAVGGASVKACEDFDAECQIPTFEGTTDPEGRITTVVPAGFDGFWEITSASTMNTLYAHLHPATSSVERDLRVLDDATFDGLANAARVTRDRSRGHLSVAVEDCSSVPAPGIVISATSTEDAQSFYLVDGVPAPGATATDASGVGGFTNVSPTIVSVEATLETTGERVARTSVLVRENFMTTLSMAVHW